ncbi:MAG: hypothetical protein JSR31_01845 [Nitrospira sp.]|nr:hypothetical protein [Nitrospira sp.]
MDGTVHTAVDSVLILSALMRSRYGNMKTAWETGIGYGLTPGGHYHPWVDGGTTLRHAFPGDRDR